MISMGEIILCACSVMTIKISSATSDPGMDYSNITTQETTENPNSVMTWKTVCPDKCTCSKDIPNIRRTFNNHLFNIRMKIVNCSSAGFTHPPKNVPFETEVLVLNENNITSLQKLPYVPNLKYLDLSNNGIDTMDKYIFAQMRQLKFISLANNNLDELIQGSFTGLLQLDHLDLAFNKITNISFHSFAHLNHLKILEIQGNRLSYLNPDWFEDVLDLRMLHLSQNLLTYISDKVFRILHILNSLHLSNNQIRSIDEGAFNSLQELRILDLSNNKITQVPTKPLQSLGSIDKVLLDANPIKKIKNGDFSAMNFTFLSVSYMNQLLLIENEAFQNLPALISLQVHDNPKLIYLDQHAFDNVPRLKRVYAHNNQLIAIPAQLLEHLPNLEEIHLYHNPLRCDCNAFWIKELLTTAQVTNYSKPFLSNSKSIKCDFPLNVTGKALEDVDESVFKRVCAPTTIQLFKEKYTIDLGDELILECHTFGVPNPIMRWTFPNGTVIDGKSHSDKVEVINDCIVIIRHLTMTDSGTYSCISDNGIGYDIGSTNINVTNKPVRLVPYTVSSDYISISWNGTKHNTMISDYQLHYRKVSKGDKSNTKPVPYKVIALGPQYRSYTVTHLQPRTVYEFCIVYVYDSEKYKVDCVNITTTAKSDINNAIRKIVNEKIIAGVCTALGFIFILACMVTLVRKFHFHKDYEPPYDMDESETVNIQLDNMYQPLTTPLCSSKTSLIEKKSSYTQDNN